MDRTEWWMEGLTTPEIEAEVEWRKQTIKEKSRIVAVLEKELKAEGRFLPRYEELASRENDHEIYLERGKWKKESESAKESKFLDALYFLVLARRLIRVWEPELKSRRKREMPGVVVFRRSRRGERGKESQNGKKFHVSLGPEFEAFLKERGSVPAGPSARADEPITKPSYLRLVNAG